MLINAIYPSWDGEVNKFGIGAPTIFVRTQGCHLRCYLKTMGTLCDTPEGLERNGGIPMDTDMLIKAILELSANTGISKITLTGGDPLWRPVAELHELFSALELAKIDCTVETSGTLSIRNFALLYDRVWWVLDYKLTSAGVKTPMQGKKAVDEWSDYLRGGDYVKFVIHDRADMAEMKCMLDLERELCSNNSLPTYRFAAGLFWGSKLSTLDLYNFLLEHHLLDRVSLNFQVHKLSLAPDFSVTVPKLL